MLLPILLFSQVINQFDGNRFTHYSIDDWISYAPALEINSIDTDENYVYFGTQKGGILRYDKFSSEWHYPYTVSSGLRSNTIYQVVYNANDGNLYARVPQGIDVIYSAENFWRPTDLKSMPVGRQPSPEDMSALKKGVDFRFPPYSRPSDDFFPNFFTDRIITYLFPDKIWDWENREFNFTDRQVDEWQRLWLGSNGLGPLYGDLYTFTLYSTPQSIPNISPRDIHIDEENIWVGGISLENGISGITKWDRNEDTWNYFEARFINGISRDDVLAIDGNKRFIAFATVDGMVIFDKTKLKWKTVSVFNGLEGEEIKDVLVVKNQVFVATEYGFNWMNLNSKTANGLSGTPIDNVQINQLTFYDNKIFAATKQGLFSIDYRLENVQFHPSKGAVSDFNLRAIEAIENEIWLAGDYGIMYLDMKSKEWHSFPGLTRRFDVRDIESTKNVVWFATDQGLLKFDREMNYWRLFTKKDGLLNNSVYHIAVEGEFLWLSTKEGITIFQYDRTGRLD